MHIHHHAGVVVARDRFKLDCRVCIAHFRQGASRGRQIGFEADLFGYLQQLVFLLEHGEELAEILVRPHEITSSLRCKLVSGRRPQCGDLPLPAWQHRLRLVQRERDSRW